ncbi:uncharacterized protein [Musca autumnalis]|uniref:uncharacterized protein n=1 Tax=Musca autumnalis TaxID=221902 RepID=UPI003CED1A10
MSGLHLGRMCLTCLQKSSAMCKLMDTTEDNYPSIELMLRQIIPTCISIVDDAKSSSLDMAICKDCLEKLTTAYDFHKMCLENNEKLHSLWREDVKMAQMLYQKIKVEVSGDVPSEYDKEQMDSIEMGPVKSEVSHDIINDVKATKKAIGNDGEQEQVSEDTTNECKRECGGEQMDFVEIGPIKLESDEDTSYGSGVQHEEEEEFTEISNLDDAMNFETSDDEEQDEKRDKSDKILNKNECPHCQKVFKVNYLLKLHLRVHNEENKHVCQICQHRFVTKKGLSLHIKYKHEYEQLLSCNICQCYIGSLPALAMHMKHSHPDVPPIKCEMCDNVFRSESHLAQHKAAKHDVQDFTCPVCGKSFKNNSIYKKHRRIHEKDDNDKHFRCTTCDRRFDTKHILERHQVVHTGEKKYACTFCNKPCAFKGDLIKHLRTHLGEKTYLCDKCPESFKYHKEWRAHKIQHDKIKINNIN